MFNKLLCVSQFLAMFLFSLFSYGNSCRVTFFKHGIHSVLPHWNYLFESRLTYKLSSEQINSMESVTNEVNYKIWMANLISHGWSKELLEETEAPHFLFRAFQKKEISLHEFMSGMFFVYTRIENRSANGLNFVNINEQNVDQIIREYIFPLTFEHRQEFKRRLFLLPPQERVFLYFSTFSSSSFLTPFSILGSFGRQIDYAEVEKLIESSGQYPKTNLYPALNPTATRTKKHNAGEKIIYSGAILSAGARQILSDLVNGENSIQNVAVIGSENSFDMAATFELGGRSIALPFPGIRAHDPHDISAVQFPLTGAYHDYYHNWKASQTPAGTRQTLVPYILRLIQSNKGRIWNDVVLVYSHDSSEKNLQTRKISHHLKFAGAQDSVEALTDLETKLYLGQYLNELGSPSNLHLNPFDNRHHYIDHYIVLAIIFRDIQKNPEFWAQMGYSQEWLQQFIQNEANYRTRFVFFNNPVRE